MCVSDSLCVGAEALCYIMLLQPTHRLTKSSVYNGIIWPKIHKREREWESEREELLKRQRVNGPKQSERQGTRKTKNGTRKIRCVF